MDIMVFFGFVFFSCFLLYFYFKDGIVYLGALAGIIFMFLGISLAANGSLDMNFCIAFASVNLTNVTNNINISGSQSPWKNDSTQVYLEADAPQYINASNVLFVDGSTEEVGINTVSTNDYSLNVFGDINATWGNFTGGIAFSDGSTQTTASAGGGEPEWEANATNMQVDCPNGYYSSGIETNGSNICHQDVVGMTSYDETDPYWTGNASDVLGNTTNMQITDQRYNETGWVLGLGYLTYESDPLWECELVKHTKSMSFW